MRSLAVSLALAATAAACMLEPAPVTAPPVSAPAPAAFAAPPRASLAVADDAFPLLETSATLDGDVVQDVAGGAAVTVVVVFASWCVHCRDELAALDEILPRHPGLRVLGVNYRAHEEYDNLGDAARVRAYVAAHAPWLVVVPAGERLFSALGRPPKVPTLYVFDGAGRLVDMFDRRTRPLPSAADLDAVVTRLGA